jgi:hypothetical protein
MVRKGFLVAVESCREHNEKGLKLILAGWRITPYSIPDLGIQYSIFSAQYSFWLMHRQVSPTVKHRRPRPLPSPSFHAQEEVSRPST